MSEEFVPTGHRIFRGGKHIEMEVVSTEMKPFVIHQPGDMEAEVTASSSTPHDDAAEDIAARIAGDRKQFQADILALAKAKKAEEDTEDGVPAEAADGKEASASDVSADAADTDADDLGAPSAILSARWAAMFQRFPIIRLGAPHLCIPGESWLCPAALAMSLT